MNKLLESPVALALRSLSPAYAILFLFSFASPILYLSTPIFMHQVFDRVMTGRNVNTLYALGVVCLFLIAMYSVLEFVRTRTLRRVAVAIDEKLSKTVFDAVYRQPSDGRPASAQSLHDLTQVRDFLTGPFIGSIFDAIWSPVFLAVMFLLHPVFGFLSLILMGASALLTWLAKRLTAADSRRQQTSAIKAMDFGASLVKTADTARVLGMLPALRDRWYGMHLADLSWQFLANRRADYVVSLVKFLRVAQFIIVTTAGTILFLQEEIGQVGIMIAFTIMIRALGPLDAVISSWQAFAGFRGAVSRLDTLLRATKAQGPKVRLPEPESSLVLNRVTAVPPGGTKPVLIDVSFALPRGQVLGVVGPSGAGKSCLARIIVGAWRPTKGSVVLGDHDVAHWDQDQLGAHIGYLPQEIDLYPGTLAENIARFTSPDTSGYAETLAAAVEMTGIQDLVRALPEGFDTQVGPGGHVLSGGQKQRVGLARAVFGNPKLVVLDEPNSNLDTFGEAALARACEDLKAAGSTVVLVTHKLNMLSVCDEILVLNAGVVQASGAREQIMSRLPRLKPTPSLTVIEGTMEGRRA